MEQKVSKASDHVKPCNIAQSEAHNKRDTEYIKSLNPAKLYIRTDCHTGMNRMSHLKCRASVFSNTTTLSGTW